VFQQGCRVAGAAGNERLLLQQRRLDSLLYEDLDGLTEEQNGAAWGNHLQIKQVSISMVIRRKDLVGVRCVKAIDQLLIALYVDCD
jgi:hypothetical protein